MLRLFVVCLSIANLCYARVWEELLGIQPDQLFWESHPPYRFQYIAAIADVLILATVFFLVNACAEKGPGVAEVDMVHGFDPPFCECNEDDHLIQF